MNSSQLVTAIVTTHNRIDLLLKAIVSVQRQTYEPIELIVVDDASNDGTREILEVLSKQQGFTYIYIPESESKGGNHARNVGILEAKGDYIAFLDDDDEWDPEKIQKQVEFMRKNPEYGVVACGKVIERNFKKRIKENITDRLEGDLSKNIFRGVAALTSEILVKKELLIDVGLFDENLKYLQEYELCMRLFQITRLGVVKEHLILYRIVEKDKNRLTNNIDGWEDAVKYINEKHKILFNALPLEIKRQYKLFVLYDAVERANKTGNRKLKKRYLKIIYEAEPTLKNWIKYRFNISNVTFIHLLKRFKETL